jgi:hypothetical protein
MYSKFDVSDDCKNKIDMLLKMHTVFNGSKIAPGRTAEQQIKQDDRWRGTIAEAIIRNLKDINRNIPKKKTFWIVLHGGAESIDQANATALFKGIADVTCKGKATDFHVGVTEREVFSWHYDQYMIQAFIQDNRYKSFYMRIRDLSDWQSSSPQSDKEDSGNDTDDDGREEPRGTIHEIMHNLHIRLNLLEAASSAGRWDE